MAAGSNAVAYSIAIPSHRKALERKASRLLALKAQKRAAKRKRHFAGRQQLMSRAAYLHRQDKRAALHNIASHD